MKRLVWSYTSKIDAPYLVINRRHKEHLKPPQGVWSRLVQTDGQEAVGKEFGWIPNSEISIRCLGPPSPDSLVDGAGKSFGELSSNATWNKHRYLEFTYCNKRSSRSWKHYLDYWLCSTEFNQTKPLMYNRSLTLVNWSIILYRSVFGRIGIVQRSTTDCKVL